MKSGIIAAVLSLGIIAAPAALAAEAETARYFTVEQAVEYAQKNSLDLISKKESEEAAKLNCEALRISTKNAYRSDYGVNSVSGYLLAGGYNYEAAKTSYRVAQRDTISTKYNLESNVKQAFYKCVNQKRKIALAEESLASANERLSYAKVKFNSGMISKMDVTSFELAAAKAQNDLNSQKRTLDEYMLNLKSVINYPLSENIDVTGSFERVPMDATPLNEARLQMASSVSRANIDDSYKLAQSKHKYYTGYYTSNLYEFQAANREFAAAKADYQKNLNSLETGITSVYNQLCTAYETLSYLDASLEYAESAAAAAKLQYEMGMKTADDYNAVIQNLDTTRNTVADTELGAYAANEAYRSMFAIKNTVLE